MNLVEPTEAAEDVAEAFELLPVINVFRAMANAESLYPPYASYLRRLFECLELDAALERMIVLRVSQQSNCFYVWRQNVVVAHNVGVTEQQIRAAFVFTDEVMRLIEVTDTTYSTARKQFSDRALTEIGSTGWLSPVVV